MREINAPVRKSEFIQVKETKKGRERPKITFVLVKKDMSTSEKERVYSS